MDRIDRLGMAKHFEQSASQKLKASDSKGAIFDARQAQALVHWDNSVDPQRRELLPREREIAVSAATTQALALAYADCKGRAKGVANLAGQLAHSAEIHPRYAVQAELTALHVSEMRRDLDTAMRELWRLGTQLQAEEWSRPEALRAFGRLIACAVWTEDTEAAARAMKEGERLLSKVDDPDAQGSYLIWPAQALMRDDKFERANEVLAAALELREGTPRRAITDTYASAYFELKHGDHDTGMIQIRDFLKETVEAGLYQYARVGLETLSPMF
jgi:hypothetical protein